MTVQLYGTPDEVWLDAAATHPSVKSALKTRGYPTYAAFFHMAKKHRLDLWEQMKAIAGTRLPVIYCGAGCGRPARAQKYGTVGLCMNCDARARRGRPVGVGGDRAVARGKQCSVQGCEEGQYAKELCNMHWQRLRAWGRVGGPERMRINWWLKGFSAEDMRACKEFVYGKRDDKPLTDEGIRLRIDYEAILREDPCAYCGATAGEIDHIDPLSLGGSPEWDNLGAACRSCNASKHATPLLKYLLARNAR